MPIILGYQWEKGWDKNNIHAPDDPILVTTFTDAKTKKILFRYGAKLEDISYWIEYFTKLGEYENKKLRAKQSACTNSKIRQADSLEGNSPTCSEKIC